MRRRKPAWEMQSDPEADMDPKANIAEQLQIAAEINRLGDLQTNDAFANECAETDIAIAGMRLAELVIAMDEWRNKGGFDPYIKRS